MALDGVPWFIGGEAHHGGDVARQLAYLATGGRQGVASPSDLKVTALSVPGGGAQVAAGGAAILNRILPQESYTVRNPVADLESVQFAATGSAAGRSDLVICRVDNPYLDSNAQAPADPQLGPYNRFDVIPDVPAGTRSLLELDQHKGLSAIPLARVDIPKSTGTITNAMITDLRSLANPRSSRQMLFGTADPGNAHFLDGSSQYFLQLLGFDYTNPGAMVGMALGGRSFQIGTAAVPVNLPHVAEFDGTVFLPRGGEFFTSASGSGGMVGNYFAVHRPGTAGARKYVIDARGGQAVQVITDLLSVSQSATFNGPAAFQSGATVSGVVSASDVRVGGVSIVPTDTGWINLTPQNGWQNQTGTKLRYRAKNGIFYLQGYLNSAATTATTFATIPSNYTPSQNIRVPATNGTGSSGTWMDFPVGSDGTLAANTARNPNFAVAWPLDQ